MKELTNKEKEQFKDFTAHIEDYWGEFMKKLASMQKPHYNAKIKSFTKNTSATNILVMLILMDAFSVNTAPIFGLTRFLVRICGNAK